VLPDPVAGVGFDATEGLPEVDVGGGDEAWVTGAVTATAGVTCTAARWRATTRCAGCLTTFGSSSDGAAGIWLVVTTLAGA